MEDKEETHPTKRIKKAASHSQRRNYIPSLISVFKQIYKNTVQNGVLICRRGKESEHRSSNFLNKRSPATGAEILSILNSVTHGN